MALSHKSETLKLKVPNFGWKNMFFEVFFLKKSRKNSEDPLQKQKLLPLGGSNILL